MTDSKTIFGFNVEYSRKHKKRHRRDIVATVQHILEEKKKINTIQY